MQSSHKSFQAVKELLNVQRRQQHIPSVLEYNGFLVHLHEVEQEELVLGRETAILEKRRADITYLAKKILQAINSGAV